MDKTKLRFSKELYRELANCIRVLTIDAVEKANSGHPGMPLGMADVATVLFAEFLQFCPSVPKWANRDRFILSAGHGSMLLYSLLYLTGYDDITLEDIKNFRQLHSKAAGHPEYGTFAGVECTTGPLGQGIANSVGMAIAAKMRKLDHSVYVIASDGCLMEGISHEACSLAGHLGLDSLILLYDDNGITIDGKKSLADSENALTRFEAYGWYTQQIDGHDFNQIRAALINAKASSLPSIISCKTVIGFGAPTKAGCESSHGAPLGTEEAANTKAFHGWCTDKHFDIPDELLNIWRNDIGNKIQASGLELQSEVKLPANLDEIIIGIKNKLSNSQAVDSKHFEIMLGEQGSSTGAYPIIREERRFLQFDNAESQKAKSTEATRKSSGRVLAELMKHTSCLISGSADLTESNYTTALSNKAPITKGNFQGNYIHYGIREHAMAGIMNGLSLYGGIIPCGGTFLVFVDYCRPSLRLSALTKLQVIYIMTHDSIGLGEDGPTHQPIEHLASLRIIPNVNVLRPADAIETAECWEIMLENTTTPSVICLTRQNVPSVRHNTRENLCKKGAYILSEFNNRLEVTIFASGSEVSIALEAQHLLHERGIGTRVISVPCMEVFDKQPTEYKEELVRNDTINIAVEAGVKFGWEKYIGMNGIHIGMDNFGKSGSYADLYKHFEITSDNIVSSVLKALEHQHI